MHISTSLMCKSNSDHLYSSSQTYNFLSAFVKLLSFEGIFKLKHFALHSYFKDCCQLSKTECKTDFIFDEPFCCAVLCSE